MMKLRMCSVMFAFLAANVAFGAVQPGDDTDYMIQSLDDLAVHFEG